MSERKEPNKGDYEIGYGKPPKHTQFVPGQSGNKGRKRKQLESVGMIIARIRDETHVVGGKNMTNIEIAIRQVVTQTIKSGKPRDLKMLFELLDKHGAMPEFDRRAEAEAGAEEALRKIFTTFNRHHDIDPADVEALERDNDAEAKLVMECTHCGPALRKRWQIPDYVARCKRYGRTSIHKLVLAAADRKAKRK
jgi:hypothetical protein